MKIQKLLCTGIAIASVLAGISGVTAQEAQVNTEVELFSEGEVELFATQTSYKGIRYEVNSSAKTATIIGFVSTWTMFGSDETGCFAVNATIGGGTYGSYKIVGIADDALTGIENITKVDLSNATNLKTIGDNAFSYCPELVEVTFRSSSTLTEIGNNAFYYCPKLTTVKNLNNCTGVKSVGTSVFGLAPFMDSNTQDFVTIGKALIKYNGNEKAVTIPTGITYISDAFSGNDITSINFSSVTEIGNYAFYGCNSLTEIVLPSGVVSVGDMAFSGCSNLKSVSYGTNLTSIGFCSFANCPSLESFKCTGTSKLTTIGECAFWNDKKLYYLDTGVIENVNVGSFWNCFGQTPDEIGSVYYYRIPETVKTIAEGGYGNLEFVYVTVPESLEAIASTAFGSTSGAIYVVPKGSLADTYFNNSGYRKINYGDMNANGKTTSNDLKTVTEYIAKNLSEILKSEDKPSDRDALNYNFGNGVVADIDGDGRLTTLDLFKIFQSYKAQYEAEKQS